MIMLSGTYPAAAGKKKLNKAIEGSLTVEAGFVFPIFIFALFAVCCIFRYLTTEYNVEKSMLAVARKLSPYAELVQQADQKSEAFIGDIFGENSDTGGFPDDFSLENIADGIADGVVIGGLIKNEMRQSPFALSAITGNENGLNCYGSELFTEDETVMIRCSYRLKLPVAMFGLKDISIEQELEFRYFTGLEVPSLLEGEETASGENDRIVYITEEKKVYHQSLDCPSLRLVIRSCLFDELGKERNVAGGKYYKCERCAKGARPEQVFITKDGDRYHYDRGCPGLKRTITEIPLSEASLTRRPCKRCRPKEE